MAEFFLFPATFLQDCPRSFKTELVVSLNGLNHLALPPATWPKAVASAVAKALTWPLEAAGAIVHTRAEQLDRRSSWMKPISWPGVPLL